MKAFIQRYGVIAFLLLAVGTAAQAQYRNDLQFNVNYNVNIPSGSFRNFISNPAWKGFTAGLAYPVTSQLRVGLSVGYND